MSMCHIPMISVQASLLPDQPGPLGMLDMIIHQPLDVSTGGCFGLAVTSCVLNSLEDKVESKNVLFAFMSAIPVLNCFSTRCVFDTLRAMQHMLEWLPLAWWPHSCLTVHVWDWVKRL